MTTLSLLFGTDSDQNGMLEEIPRRELIPTVD
jgi:hypothetical protein